jgi:ketosteroid isomerase-like protein
VLTDDYVLLEPDAPAIVGKDAILSANQKDKAEHPSSKVLSYKPEIHDLQVSAARLPNGLIFEASYKESENGLPKTFHAKALRVLRREPNGEWKFSRLMWNSAS